ncbi:MAG: sugar ABC transporter ATP-binding protein [Propioniciclava sp.]
MVPPLLEASGIAKSYGAVVALRSADLSIKAGEIHALLGANGAGKSTLVKILTGVVPATAGTVTLEQTALKLGSPASARRAGIAPVHQDPALVPDLTVAQNLRLTRTSAAAVAGVLADLGVDGLEMGEYVRDIPLPFLRILDLARALAHRPRLLVLDEITAALPTDLAARVFAVMHGHAEAGGAVLFISHRLAEVVEHCDQCTVFRDGRTVARFVPREGGEQKIVASMLGEAASQVRHEARRSHHASVTAEPRLRLTRLGAGRTLDEVSLCVRPGEVLAIVGLEGQGQDALFDVVAGLRRADRGRISVDDVGVNADHPAGALEHGIALAPADRSLAILPERPIEENLTLGLYRRLRSWGPIPQTRIRQQVGTVIDALAIDTRAGAQARRLSGGNQQKLTIGRWLTAGFGTLLLFDPTRGIDIGTKHLIYDVIRNCAETGGAILMYTSELREVRLVADRVLVLYRGRVVAEMEPTADEAALLAAMHGLDTPPTPPRPDTPAEVVR